ncbi:MAG: response regulator [Kangiellaceae bacterium]|nr:response regulator [Kangiellaceae bacterium]
MVEVLNVKQPKILCVDDEIAVLNSLRRIFKRAGYLADIQLSPMSALEDLTKTHYDVIISDMRMPEMDGAEFLSAAEKFAPDSVRILLTGYADLDSTARAVNDGKIYSYVNKPWDNGELKQTVEQALIYKNLNDSRKHSFDRAIKSSKQLQQANSSLTLQVKEANEDLQQTASVLDFTKEELFETHKQTVRVFAELLDIKNIGLKKYQSELVMHLKSMCRTLGLKAAIAHDVENAAALYHLGKLALPPELSTLARATMTLDQSREFELFPCLAEEILLPLIHMHGVGKILKDCRENYDGSGYPKRKIADQIPLAAKILRVVVDFFEQLSIHPDNDSQACIYLSENSGLKYDPAVVDAYLEFYLEHRVRQPVEGESIVAVTNLKLGSIIATDLYTSGGMLLLASGTLVSKHLIKALMEYESNRGINLYVSVINEKTQLEPFFKS